MTIELFRHDSYLKACDAMVTAVSENGIALQQTVFYPEGGGQPGDHGRIIFSDDKSCEIINTRKSGDGIIWHEVAADLPRPAVGESVQAQIDWDYRYAHMRMHTCLHLLCSLIPHPVTGGSIAQGRGRLDFDMSEGIDKAQIEAALNALISGNHTIGYRWISDDEMAANMELVRTMSVKPPMGTGSVRLVEVAGIDLQPCGGTHVKTTGEIGTVTVGKVESKGKHNRRVNLHLG